MVKRKIPLAGGSGSITGFSTINWEISLYRGLKLGIHRHVEKVVDIFVDNHCNA